MITFILAFFASLIVATFIIRSAHLHAPISADHNLEGVQKFHHSPVPRVGGVALCAGITCTLFYWYWTRPDVAWQLFIFSCCSAPAFLGGLAEDMTSKVGVLPRLTLTMLAGVLAYYFMGCRITHIDIMGLDSLFSWSVVSLLVTVFAIGGLANAINIIDGYNGLCAAVCFLMLVALAYVAFKVGDSLIVTFSLTMIGAVLGFFFWNWPWGKIFLGDGGAYLLGFWIATSALLLVVRNPQVSPWFPFMLVAYPVVETLFSIYRRMFVKKVNPSMPDAAHLHQIIFKRLVRWTVGSEAQQLTMRNSMTAPYLWLISSFSIVPAVVFWDVSWALQLCSALFLIFYVWLYIRIIRFKMPKWLVFHSKYFE